MATMTKVAGAQHLADAYGAPPQPGELGCGSHPPSTSFFGLRSSSELESPGRSMCGLQVLEPPFDSRVSSPAPPPREMVPVTKRPYVLMANPEAHLAQSKRLAHAALEHYNKRKKIKFELVDVKPCISVPERRCCYTHINFTARSSKEGSPEQLFFAELCHCGTRRGVNTAKSCKEGSKEQRSFSGRRGPPRGFIVTCCEPLGPDSTVGQKFLQRDDTTGVRKHADFTYCFACSERTSHPKGEKYIAGHCNIPSVYNCVR